ncbi:carbohydrate ABC transporter permease [Paenibacillus sp. GCM10027628]|uniref:carbohydrate ABC transporter permease n=1 Tax=Paenibacillus sp. GCM10027628 TaxID=3273413 RepID=UPI00364418A9
MAKSIRLRRTTLKRGRITPYLFVLPWIIGFVSFTMGPLLFSLVISLYDWPITGQRHFIGLQNYINMFTDDPLFWHSLGVTVKFALMLVPLNLAVSLLLAMLLNQKIRASGLFRTIFYLPSVISGVALSMIWSWIFSGEYGLLNYVLSLIGITGPDWLRDPNWALAAMVGASLWAQGSMVLIYLAGLKNIPADLYESASMDGANAVRRFFSITLPMLSPTILFNLITSIIAAFQQLTLALTLTSGGPLKSTYFYAMYVYENAFKYFHMGYSAANAWVMFLIVLCLTFLVFKSSSMWVFYESEVKQHKGSKRGKEGSK